MMYPTLSTLPPAIDGRILLNPSLLKNLRKRRALSQEALAELCLHRQLCVSVASIKRAETGKVVLYRTARHLATVFEVQLEQLLAPPADVTAAAPGAGSTALAGLADGGRASDDTVRYVIELHVALSFSYAADSPALKTVAQLAQQFGGQLQPPSAQALVIVFGYPQAYRSDAERALCCALALRSEHVAAQARALLLRSARWQEQVQRRDGDVFRNVMTAWQNVSTTPLPVYVAQALSRQLATRFAFAPASKTSAARGPRYALFEQTLAHGDSLHQPLIGRHAEIRQFKGILHVAEQYQSGHVLYLRGMAGLGKTRLATEFADIARQQGYDCHHSDILDNGTENWLTILGRLACSLLELTHGDADSAQQIHAAMTRLALPSQSELFYRVLAAAPLNAQQQALYAEMPPETRSLNVIKALHILILCRAIRCPLLLTIEDLHWGDSHLFEALGMLLSLTCEAPVVWAMSARRERDPLDDTLRHYLGDLALSIFDLAPLGVSDANILAAQFDDVDIAHRQRCVERAQGNPLFLTQLLSSPEAALPDSLRHLVQSRLDDLDAGHRHALRMAAVLGNDFELALLRQAINEPHYQPHDAGRNCLVRRSGPERYRFVHDLVMHCIYDAIEPAQRHQFHRMVAELFRARNPRLHALHLHRSGDPAAAEAILRAVDIELAAYHFDVAMELCELSGAGEPDNARLPQLRARAAVGLGQNETARRCYLQALELAVAPQERIAIVIGLAAVLNMLDDLVEEQRLLDIAIPLARALHDDAALAQMLCLKGNICFPRGEFAAGRRLHEAAARHAQSGAAVEIEAQAISGIGDSCYAQGRMPSAYRTFKQCLAMCREHRLLALEASNRSALASTLIYLGQPAAAIENALGAVQLARQICHHRAEMVAHLTAGWVLLGSGQAEQAEIEIGQGLTLSRSLGAVRFEPFLQEGMARALWQQGRIDQALQKITAAADTVERLQLYGFIGPWVFGTLALLSDDPVVRRQALARGEVLLQQDCVAHNALRFLVSAAETALLDGDADAAFGYVKRLTPYAALESCAWLEYHTMLLRQCALGVQGTGDAEVLASLRRRGQNEGFSHTMPRLQLWLEQR
jgi:tetratricopeptide (TPR) repeat protein/transcriptional regulator with XRE-family HTH domain